MDNSQKGQPSKIDNLTFFTAGDGSNDLNRHRDKENLDLSGDIWTGRDVSERLQSMGNTAFSSNSEPVANTNSPSPEQGGNIPLETPRTRSQEQFSHDSSQQNFQPSPTELAVDSINRAPIVDKKFSDAGVKEVGKIIHLMTEDPNSGEKLADGYDIARNTNIMHLSKYGAQSAWMEDKTA